MVVASKASGRVRKINFAKPPAKRCRQPHLPLHPPRRRRLLKLSHRPGLRGSHAPGKIDQSVPNRSEMKLNPHSPGIARDRGHVVGDPIGPLRAFCDVEPVGSSFRVFMHFCRNFRDLKFRL